MLDNKKKNPHILLGFNEISSYVGRSKGFVTKALKKYDFPAKKIEGRWQSDKRKIDDWLLAL